jgi:hypothetical protein
LSPLDDDRARGARPIQQWCDQVKTTAGLGPVAIVDFAEIRQRRYGRRRWRDRVEIHDGQPDRVVGFHVASNDKVEADELHNNEATPAALNLGAVFDREAAHGRS